MKITTSVTFEICDTLGEYREISRTSFEHDGFVALAKKGRDQQSCGWPKLCPPSKSTRYGEAP